MNIVKKILDKVVGIFQIFGLPTLAVVGLLHAVSVVKAGGQPPAAALPVVKPAQVNFEHFVAGAGVIESQNENVAIATQVSGVVSEILVQVGQSVNAQDVLFKLDSRSENAALQVALAQQESAQRDYDFIVSIKDKRAVSFEEFTKRQNALKIAKANTEQAQVAVDLRTIKAPRAGKILKINIRAGEFAASQTISTPLMVLGDTSSYWVRVDVDENDAWRIPVEGSKATASLRGNSTLKTDLKFVRFEPYVIPKKSLTGDNSERVDTRVLQLIFKLENQNFPVFVGQLMDVYIEAKSHE